MNWTVNQEIAKKAFVLGHKVGQTENQRVKSRLESYRELAGENLTPAKRRLIKQAFAEIEQERDKAAEKWMIAEQQANEKYSKLFEDIITRQKYEVEQAALEILAKKTCYDSGILTIYLTESYIEINIKMPAYWSDTATVRGRFDTYGKEKGLALDVNYGAGGYNSGVSSVEAARQKAEALLIACDIVDELNKMDWKHFFGYSSGVVALQKRIYEQMKEADIEKTAAAE